MAEAKTVIIGRPGTGKTHYLMDILDKTDPRGVIFVSFTRSAIAEATKRAKEKWGLERKDLPYFRTMHSLCSRIMSLTPLDYLEEREIFAFMADEGIPYDMGKGTFAQVEDQDVVAARPEDVKDGNKLLLLLDYIKNTECAPLNELKLQTIENQVSLYLSGMKFTDARFDNIDAVIKILWKFEAMRGNRLHYTDILLNFLKYDGVLPKECTTLIVDEFQDLSPLGYRIVKKLESCTQIQYYAGDQHQAIYVFMGANPEILLREWNQDGISHVNLPVSHRMRERIWDVAKKIINDNCADRITDSITVGSGGEIRNLDREEILLSLINETRPTYILTRTNAIKREWQAALDSRGIPYVMRGTGAYVWHNKLVLANNFIAAMAKGESVDHGTAIGFLKECVPAKPFLRRGVKVSLPEIFKGKEMIMSVDIQGLLAIGYNYTDLTNLEALKLNQEEKKVLQERIFNGLRPISLNISLGTIHSHKGGEADIVIYDATMSGRMQNDIRTDPRREAEEARIAYVAVTRTKSELWVVGTNPILGGANG